MIVPMKKIVILTLKSYENQTLTELRDLGVLHLNNQVFKNTDAKDRMELITNQSAIERVIGVLEQYKLTQNSKKDNSDGYAIFKRAERLLSEKDLISQELEVIKKSIFDMEDWGDFDFAQLEEYQKQGLRLYLCFAPNDDKLKEFATNENCHLIELNRGKSGINFVLVSTVKLDKSRLPLANINCEKSLKQLKNEAKSNTKKLAEINNEIIELAKNVEILKSYKDELVDEIEFVSTRDAMTLEGEISYIDGFVPETMVKEVEEAAKSNSWGYLMSDAPKSVEVPTLVEMPKFAKIITPLFDFLAISPGYNELDVSGAFVVFFSIFFGILLGDAGYGVIFLLLGIFGLTKSKSDMTKKALFKMVVMLSIFAIVWGLATNNVFGKSIPGLGLHFLTDESTKNANTQLICFILGLAQLSLGHFWKAILDFKWRNVGAQLGWVAIMIGNFILIVGLLPKSFEAPMLMKCCYVAGILLVAFCDVNWKDAASIFGFPSGVVNSFVDLLSYIRLFAVGLAGYYLALSFNNIAGPLFEKGIFGIVGAVIVLLFGHVLNIALAMLSVLVHGVRLNTLEFSSHIGLQWTGFKYKPFKKNK